MIIKQNKMEVTLNFFSRSGDRSADTMKTYLLSYVVGKCNSLQSCLQIKIWIVQRFSDERDLTI